MDLHPDRDRDSNHRHNQQARLFYAVRAPATKCKTSEITANSSNK